ncbi:IclR family transcriptional regulator [Microbacterium sp.]|uniref:IclR family transcriptional regulator n=1 Tax=Microbacterium sp. TaxID=51671 RepID=UPI003A868E66
MRTAEWTDSVSVLDRVTAILDAIGADDRGIGISELSRRANLPKSTVSRIVADLVKRRYLERDGNSIHLGFRLFELGQLAEHPRELREAALPIMADLRSASGEAVHLSVLEGGSIVVLAALRGGAATSPPVRVGERLPAAATASGKALLAHTTPEMVDALMASARPEVASAAADTAALRQELVATRQTGVATARDDRAGPGLVAVASPVLSDRGEPLAAIAVSGVLDTNRVAPAVRTAALTLSRRMGARQRPASGSATADH